MIGIDKPYHASKSTRHQMKRCGVLLVVGIGLGLLTLSVSAIIYDSPFKSLVTFLSGINSSQPHHVRPGKTITAEKEIDIVKHVAMGGRIGNQLFEHAATLAIAKTTGKQACVIGKNVELIDKYFVNGGLFLRNCTNTVPSQVAFEIGYGVFSPLPKADRSLEVHGYLQSWKYFAGVEAEISRAFTLKPKSLRYVDELFGQSKEEEYNVGIHMRWFEIDYLREPPKEFYQVAMEYFRHKYQKNKNKKVRFYLASSDIQRSMKLGIFTDKDVVVLENEDDVNDFAVLMSCDGMILSSGTFGWWVSWLGTHQRNGEVVYFSDVFGMNHSINKGQVNKEDYYPPNWKQIAPEDISSAEPSFKIVP